MRPPARIKSRSDPKNEEVGLGVACQEQGFRTEGANGTDLLVQAGIAYRSALEVFTLEQFPEFYATLQNNLGLVLQEQARRTANAMGTELLAQAVVAYREASAAFGREQRPFHLRLIRKVPWETSWCTLTTNAVSVSRFICIAHCGFLLPAAGPEELRVGSTDQPVRLAHAEKKSVGGFSRGGDKKEISH